LRVVADAPLPVGEQLKLLVGIPWLEKAIPARGRIVRTRTLANGKEEWGMSFEEISPSDQEALAHRIEAAAGPSGMARQGRSWWRAVAGGIGGMALVLAHVPCALAQALPAASPAALVSSEEQAGGLREFFRQRTRWGIGFDEVYDQNIFLTRGASRQDDLATTLESQIAFADPRGNWLYGASYEVNAFRHHRLDHNGVDHEMRAYAHYTPIGRYRLVFSDEFRVDDRLVAETKQQDVIRRFANVTRQWTNQLGMEATYDVDRVTVGRLKYGWGWLSDDAPDSAQVDNFSNDLSLTLHRDLTRQWTIFCGYSFGDVAFPDAPAKDSTRHGGLCGVTYAMDPETTATFQADVTQRSVEDGQSSLELDLDVKFSRVLTPRTLWTAEFQRRNVPSAGSSAQIFESNLAAFHFSHTLSQKISVSWGGRYEHQDRQAKQTDRWQAEAGFTWQIRPEVACAVQYGYQLFSQEDISGHTATFGIEAQLW